MRYVTLDDLSCIDDDAINSAREILALTLKSPDLINRIVYMALSKVEARMNDLAAYQALDREARIFVLKVMGGEATDHDHGDFEARPDSKEIAQWMLTLPAFQEEPDEEPDDA